MTTHMGEHPAFFPRNFRKEYPEVVRAEGCYLHLANGQKVLDAIGGAAVVSIGHGVESVAQAMADQARRVAFAHTSEYHTPEAKRLAQRLRALAPANFHERGRVLFTSGGSEATESVIKLVRRYWLDRGEPQRVRVVSRWMSYHGSTVGALSVSGNIRRRRTFAPLLHEWGHIPPCYCYRCPLGKTYPECNVACADELENLLESSDASTVAAFILEPVSGATLGAATPPDGYMQRIAEICKRRGILLIADEVMTGMGRTGKPFAVQHWGIEPDIITTGKGVASGYAPVGGVLASSHVVETIEKNSGVFEHGFTYMAHPVGMATANAVLDYIEQHKLFERVAPAGRELMAALEPLKKFRTVGDVRGMGLLAGIEFVKDKATREPFDPGERFAERLAEATLEEGVAIYPMKGCADGDRGDHALLAPPFTISSSEIAELAQGLTRALVRMERDLT